MPEIVKELVAGRRAGWALSSATCPVDVLTEDEPRHLHLRPIRVQGAPLNLEEMPPPLLTTSFLPEEWDL